MTEETVREKQLLIIIKTIICCIVNGNKEYFTRSKINPDEHAR